MVYFFSQPQLGQLQVEGGCELATAVHFTSEGADSGCEKRGESETSLRERRRRSPLRLLCGTKWVVVGWDENYEPRWTVYIPFALRVR